MDKLRGSMASLSAIQATADTDGKDAPSKTILRHAEILAVILKGTVAEYKSYSLQEIQKFIVPDSIIDNMEVSPGRTNTELRGDNTEFIHLNEKTTHFDLAFQARNPQLSTEDIQINLHIDLEPQKTYKPGYPIEKRGLYYLARRLSSQLSLVWEGTDYNLLSKCYSIFICRDDIPPKDRYSISFYEITNTKNTAPGAVARENYDLMTLVVIKLGDEVYNGAKEDDEYNLFRFLNAIMYPHKEDFMSTVTEYIDYSENAELWKEVTQMSSLEQVVHAGVRDDALKSVQKEVEAIKKAAQEEIEAAKADVEAAKTEAEAAKTEAEAAKTEAEAAKTEAEAAKEKGIQALILDNLDEQIPRERILIKLQTHFSLTKEQASLSYEKYAPL
ncbi:MAG: Rpn family recombination-promoting nuclease/putative transposase [Lachnospiraceae bacterium]